MLGTVYGFSVPQQNTHTDFQGVTLAALHRDKVAVTCLPADERSGADGPLWTLPHLGRVEGRSPAETALLLAEGVLGFALPVTRLNWPILCAPPAAAPDLPPTWFFAAWLSPLEWEVLSRDGGPRNALMIGVDVYLRATTVLPEQQASLRQYLSQSRSAPQA